MLYCCLNITAELISTRDCGSRRYMDVQQYMGKYTRNDWMKAFGSSHASRGWLQHACPHFLDAVGLLDRLVTVALCICTISFALTVPAAAEPGAAAGALLCEFALGLSSWLAPWQLAAKTETRRRASMMSFHGRADLRTSSPAPLLRQSQELQASIVGISLTLAWPF